MSSLLLNGKSNSWFYIFFCIYLELKYKFCEMLKKSVKKIVYLETTITYNIHRPTDRRYSFVKYKYI